MVGNVSLMWRTNTHSNQRHDESFWSQSLPSSELVVEYGRCGSVKKLSCLLPAAHLFFLRLRPQPALKIQTRALDSKSLRHACNAYHNSHKPMHHAC